MVFLDRNAGEFGCRLTDRRIPRPPVAAAARLLLHALLAGDPDGPHARLRLFCESDKRRHRDLANSATGVARRRAPYRARLRSGSRHAGRHWSRRTYSNREFAVWAAPDRDP